LLGAGYVTARLLPELRALPPTPEAYLSKSGLVAPASVMVFKEGDYAVAVDGKTRKEIARSTDHAEVIQEAIDVADDGDRIVIVSDLDFGGKSITIDKRLDIDFTGKTVNNGQIIISKVTYGSLGNLRMVSPQSPAIHRLDSHYHTLYNIIMHNLSGVGLLEDAQTAWAGVNRAYNLSFILIKEGATALKIYGDGKQNNLNMYYNVLITGATTTNTTGVEINNAQDILHDMNIFFGLWIEDLGTGIKYYKGRYLTILGLWHENNTVDIDITDGYDLRIYGRMPASSLVINNPNNRQYIIFDTVTEIVQLRGRFYPAMTPGNASHTWIAGKENEDMLFNVPSKDYVYRFWFNNASHGEFRVAGSTTGDITISAVDKNLRVSGLAIPTSPPTTPIAGSMYFDPDTGKLYIYDGSAWKSVSLT